MIFFFIFISSLSAPNKLVAVIFDGSTAPLFNPVKSIDALATLADVLAKSAT
jgi:hypothetical protein